VADGKKNRKKTKRTQKTSCKTYINKIHLGLKMLRHAMIALPTGFQYARLFFFFSSSSSYSCYGILMSRPTPKVE